MFVHLQISITIALMVYSMATCKRIGPTTSTSKPLSQTSSILFMIFFGFINNMTKGISHVLVQQLNEWRTQKQAEHQRQTDAA